jgi:23S rRNA maturation-related 3'-5' exoribonuclease YhaM
MSASTHLLLTQQILKIKYESPWGEYKNGNFSIKEVLIEILQKY